MSDQPADGLKGRELEPSGTKDYINTTRKLDERSYCPISKIPLTNLYTGVRHTIRLARMSERYLKVSIKQNCQMNHFVTTENHYKTNDPKLKSFHWIFERIENTSRYWLRIADPQMVTGTASRNLESFGDGTSEQVLVIEERENRLQEGYIGARKESQVEIITVNASRNLYKLRFNGEKISFVRRPKTNKTKIPLFYFNNDREAIFEITLLKNGVTFIGDLSEFEFLDSVDDILSKAKTGTTQITKRDILNPTAAILKETISRTIEYEETIGIAVETPMSFLTSVSVGFSFPAETGSVGGDANFEYFRTNDSWWTNTTLRKYKFTGSLDIPAQTTVKYTLYFQWLDKEELRFRATMELFGETPRLVIYPSHIRELNDDLVTVDILREELSKVKDWEKFEFIQSGDPKLLYSQLISVAGRVKGNFGIRIYLLTENTREPKTPELCDTEIEGEENNATEIYYYHDYDK